jgi:hypothetical protein
MIWRLFTKTIFLCVLLIPITAIAQAIMGTTGDGALAVIFPTPESNLPNPTQVNVSGLPQFAEPHGVAFFECNRALVSDFNGSHVFVVDVANGLLLSTINTAPNYNGTGTIAVAPNLSYALAIGFSSVLNAISAPFDSASTITQVTLPGGVQGYQTQAIVFDSNSRAYVYHSAGISVLDPPYTSIAFTIPVTFNFMSGAIAINAAGDKLLVTDLNSPGVNIFTAPFSAASTSEFLSIPQAQVPDGINITPDGNTALVAAAASARLFAITAPFNTSSNVEEIPLPPLGGTVGFEDIGISSDGQLAILTGNSGFNESDLMAAFVEAPFTTSGAVAHAVTVNGPGRGAGAVRFIPPGLALVMSPPTLPDATIGTPYLQTITSTGTAPFVFSISNGALPQGLSLDSTTGVISGTPTLSGSFSFTISATDEAGCSGGRGYTVNVAGTGCTGLFSDDFEDNIFDWRSIKPTWIETGGNLVGTPTGKKAIAIAPETFAGCLNCKFSSSISFSDGQASKVWILSHYIDKKNTLELKIKSNGKMKLMEKENGSRRQKVKGFYEMVPNTFYTVDVEFDGTNIIVSIDGNAVITAPPVGNLQSGTLGFQSKFTTLSVAEVCVQ